MDKNISRLCTSESEQIAQEFISNWSHYLSLVEDSNEKDVLSLIDLLDNTRVNWQKSEAEAKFYKSKVTTLEKKANILQKDNDKLHDRLLNCQSELVNVLNAKKGVESELSEHKRIIEKLRNIIKSNDENLLSDGLLAVINSTSKLRSAAEIDNTSTTTSFIFEQNQSNNTSHSDIDYDKTADSMDASFEYSPPNQQQVGPSRKRRSRSETSDALPFNLNQFSLKKNEENEVTPLKRSRNNGGYDTEITATIKINGQTNKPTTTTGKVTGRHSAKKRSLSESTVAENEKVVSKPQQMTTTTPQLDRIAFDGRSPLSFANSWTRGQDIEHRKHRVIKALDILGSCDVCKNYIKTIKPLHCVDCNIRFHEKCFSRAPMPCVPRIMLPNTNKTKEAKIALVDYCPDSHPYIPSILIHCVIALERGGGGGRLSREGIYRIPGREETIGKLCNEFITSRLIPDLADFEAETIISCIKMFLNELKDKLIPATSFDGFKKAIIENNENDDGIVKYVFELPAPNRDTLAYFILHLQKVAKYSNQNKMTLENLAKVLAPTIIGYSKLHAKTLENANELCHHQFAILLRLLQISSEFWNRFITYNMSAILAQEARASGTKTSMLTVTPKSSHKSADNRIVNNPFENTAHQQQQFSSASKNNDSPLIRPLSKSTKAMRGIYLKDVV